MFADDVFVVSFPRSGNTWTRFLIGNSLLPKEEVSFVNIERVIPDIYEHADYELRKMPRPRILKSHEYFDPRYPRVIYVVRDPRDVVLSYFRYYKKVGDVDLSGSLERFVERFVAGEVSQFGSWGENVRSWIATRGGDPERFLLVRYEDMLKNTLRETRRMIEFLGFNVPSTSLRRAVELSSANRMRSLEQDERENAAMWSIKHGDENTPFVGRATSGVWRKKLPSSCVNKIVHKWSSVMQELGYVC